MSSKLLAVAIGVLFAILVFVGVAASDSNLFTSQLQTSNIQTGVLSSYDVVYFRQPSTETGLLASGQVGEIVGAEVAESWSTVLELDDESDLDAVIIHADSLTAVNQGEIREMYRKGVAIAVFNVYTPRLSELLADDCIGKDGWMDGISEPIEGDFYLLVTRLIQGSPEDVARLEESDYCSQEGVPENIEHRASIRRGMAANGMNSIADLSVFAQVLLVKIQSIDDAIQNFQSGGN